MSDYKAKYTKFSYRWVSAPNPTGRAYSASRSCIKGATVLLRGGRARGRKGKGEEREWRGDGQIKGREGESSRWREEFGPPKDFGMVPPLLTFVSKFYGRLQGRL